MDLSRDNPVGRIPDFSRTRRAALSVHADGWQLGSLSRTWESGSLVECLTTLNRLHEVTISGHVPEKHLPALDAFTRVAIARGTFLTKSDLSLPRAGKSGLLESLPRHDSGLSVGDLSWDVAAVRQRRSVITEAVREFPPVSAVLVTRRASLVEPMVRRLAAMNYSNLEIVVGVHGQSVPPGIAEAAGDRPIIVKSFSSDMVFGRVLNETFAEANGTLVTKIDDDDHYGPDHLLDLVLAHRYSRATLVGKATTVVHLEALNATVRRVFGQWETFTHRVAGGTMLLSLEDFSALGGWPEVPRGVDTGLLAKVKKTGGRTYYPHDIGYIYVRDSAGDHTWETDISHFLRNTRQQWVGLLAHADFGTGELDKLDV